MNPEPCIICGNAAEIHVDERRNRHIVCPKCGGYIAADGFAPHYVKIEGTAREAFAAWMARTHDKPNRFLYKTRPLKSNPYSSRDGFEMLSVSRILGQHY